MDISIEYIQCVSTHDIRVLKSKNGGNNYEAQTLIR